MTPSRTGRYTNQNSPSTEVVMRRILPALLLLIPTFVQAQPKPVTATPGDQLKVAKGFKVELLYSVPKEEQGSWVCMTDLPDGRLVVSDQYDKGLFLVTPANGIDPKETSVRPMKPWATSTRSSARSSNSACPM